MLSLSKAQDKLQCVSSTEVWPYNDRIQVTKLFTLSCSEIENCPLTIIAIKGGFVIAAALDMDGTVVATCPYLVGNLSVTGKSCYLSGMSVRIVKGTCWLCHIWLSVWISISNILLRLDVVV
jgi:hypothetical protein